MHTLQKYNVSKASNYPEQKLLSELELLNHLERHYSETPATRIYVAPRCYIIPDFFKHALSGMLISLEEQDEYEACGRIVKLLHIIKYKESLLP